TLVGSYARTRPFDDVLLRDLPSMRFPQDDERLHGFAAIVVLRCDHADFLNRWMSVHLRLDLRGPHLVAGRIDHPFQAIDEKEVPVFVDITEIAGAKEALACDVHEGIARCRLLLPVACKDLRPP